MKSLKNRLTILLFITVLPIFSQTNTQQETNTLSLDSGSIANQFEYVVTKSNGWTDLRGRRYEVVRVKWLEKLKTNTLDSLKAIQRSLNNTKSLVSKQEQEISQLKTNLTTTKQNLEQTNTEKNSMSFFGLQMSKIGYNGLMWSIIAGLLALLLLFIYKFKNSNSITKQAKQALLETEEEFEEHRRIALEREQKVRRKLQDEINKNKKS